MSESDETKQPEAKRPAPGDPLAAQGIAEEQDSRVTDTLGAPTWPIVTPDSSSVAAPPPVGLNWGAVAERLGVDRRVLQHDGQIILRGEYFPESGYFIDPSTLLARFVDVGEIALAHGYFIGELTMNEFGIKPELAPQEPGLSHPVIPAPSSAPIIGLFADERGAGRARDRILRGSIGAELSSEVGPLGVELRVGRSERGGAVATVIAAQAGAVISIGGTAVTPSQAGGSPLATGPSMVGEQADTLRGGTGVASDSQRPAAEWGGSEELRQS